MASVKVLLFLFGSMFILIQFHKSSAASLVENLDGRPKPFKNYVHNFLLQTESDFNLLLVYLIDLMSIEWGRGQLLWAVVKTDRKPVLYLNFENVYTWIYYLINYCLICCFPAWVVTNVLFHYAWSTGLSER